MPAASVTTRFAPSPSGHLHLGHAFSAFFCEESARDRSGRFLLRIEDIDSTRCRPHFADDLIEDLKWLGLKWDGAPLYQSTRSTAYDAALAGLAEMGVLYPCFCTRADIKAEIAGSAAAPHGPDGPLYPGTCRGLDAGIREERLAAGIPYALRLDVAKAKAVAGPLTWRDLEQGDITARPEIFGDVVLARKDIRTSYHLAVTLDDAFQEITLVTRGEDLFAASHIHRLLQALLQLPVPQWHHHRLLQDERGQRLAKRHDALSLRELRAQGKTPADLRRIAGFSA